MLGRANAGMHLDGTEAMRGAKWPSKNARVLCHEKYVHLIIWARGWGGEEKMGAGGRGKWEILFNGHRESMWDNDKF